MKKVRITEVHICDICGEKYHKSIYDNEEMIRIITWSDEELDICESCATDINQFIKSKTENS